MYSPLKPLLLAALAALASPLAAQDQQAPAAEAPAAQPDAGLSLGEEAAALGETYIREEIGDWSLRCVRTQNQEDPCQLYQLLEDANGNSVAEISLFRLPPGGRAEAGATIITPLETLLTEQITLAVDAGKAKRYPFSFCNQIGCFARIGLTTEDVAAFKRGAKATLSIVPFAAPDQKVDLDISLTGFTAGYGNESIASPQP